jgi:aspartate 1-decarboxylase
VKRTMLKSKIHRATVTEARVDYVGSITIDADLLERADMLPYEKVLVADCDNGARLETYVIEGPPGSGVVCINGAAARLVEKGDKVIIISFASYEEAEAHSHKPLTVFVNDDNEPVSLSAARDDAQRDRTDDGRRTECDAQRDRSD